jgi:hypothetical protein
MLTYPAGMLAVGSQHRKEVREEARRWRLVRHALPTRRGRHATSARKTADRLDHATISDAQPYAAASRGRIAGWVAAGGRGRVDIAPNPPTGAGAGYGPRPRGSPIQADGDSRRSAIQKSGEQAW